MGVEASRSQLQIWVYCCILILVLRKMVILCNTNCRYIFKTEKGSSK